jgi:non-ribosomal peptide synthetase component F
MHAIQAHTHAPILCDRIARAGSAFAPFVEQERGLSLARATQAPFLVCTQEGAASVSSLPPALFGDGAAEVVPFLGSLVLVLLQPAATLHSTSAAPRVLASVPVACVYQTSGTTGRPKTILITHRCLASNVAGLRERLRASRVDVFVLSTALSFDPSLMELFLPLTLGAALVLVSGEVRQSPLQLLRVLEERCVTVFQATPSSLRRSVRAIFSPRTLHSSPSPSSASLQPSSS